MRPPRSLALVAATLIATIAVSGCKDVGIESAGGATPTTGSAATAASELRTLTVATGLSMAGYSRARFHIWSSQGGGCDTRDLVLKRQGDNVDATADCKIVHGTWTSPYNDKTYTDPQDLQIDHVVPLANAWLSGAKNWTDDQREAFGNDLTRPQLLAVDGHDNESKGDQDPSQWKPPSHDFWCTYAKDWITVKSFWKLTVTTAEKSALQDMLATCA
ncbi:MAG TPA: HNH endonuclease family protein [Micromonosporaceae bacterium]|nr:HNH endonuclease family protein [Micromonosporaceae bacterium]